MSGEAKQPPAVRELFPAVVTALESRLLTAVERAASPPSSSALPVSAPHAPQDHHPPAPHHPHPAPQIYQPQHPRVDSPHGSMDDHRTTATAGSGSTTLQQQPLLASTSTPAGYALDQPTHAQPHAHAQDPPAPPTPAKERVLSMSEKDVTDARMMPVPQTAYQPSRHPSVAYRDQGPYPSAPLSRAPTTTRRASQVDWIVPTRQDERTRDTVSRRLQPTIDVAKKRHFALSAKAKLFGRSLNAAIGLQIVVGALITGLAAVTTGRQTSIMTSVLGAPSVPAHRS